MKFYIVLVALCLIAVTQARYYRRQAGQQQGQAGGDGQGQQGLGGKSHAKKWARLVIENVKFVNCLLEHDEYDTAKEALLAEVKDETERQGFRKGVKEFEEHVDKLHKIKEDIDEILEDAEKDAEDQPLSEEQLKKLEEDLKAKKEEKKKIREDLEKLFEQVSDEDMKKVQAHFENNHDEMIKYCLGGHSGESHESSESQGDQDVQGGQDGQDTQGGQDAQGTQENGPAKRDYKELLNVLKALINKRK